MTSNALHVTTKILETNTMKPTMRAAVYRGIEDVRVETIDVPPIGEGEVLIRVGVCGVCGTDLKKIHWGLVPPPRIFGHETAGTIATVGANVRSWKVGDRVVINHHVPCLKADCFYCARRVFAQCPVYKRTGTTAGFEPAGGGFAEYVRVMDWCVERGMVAIPDDISFEEASFLEPLNTCLKGVETAGIQSGDTALIIGQGPIGLLFTQIVKLAGAHVIASDRLDYRLAASLRYGADYALKPSTECGSHESQITTTSENPAKNDSDKTDVDTIPHAIERLSAGRGADVVIVAVPVETSVLQWILSLLRPGGKVLLFANTRLNDPIEVDAGAICMQEKTLIGSYSSDINLQARAAELIFKRRIDVSSLVTHRFPLGAINEALDYASHPRDSSLKVIVEME